MLISVLRSMQKHSESSKYLLSVFQLNPFLPNVLLEGQNRSRGPKCTHPWRSIWRNLLMGVTGTADKGAWLPDMTHEVISFECPSSLILVFHIFLIFPIEMFDFTQGRHSCCLTLSMIYAHSQFVRHRTLATVVVTNDLFFVVAKWCFSLCTSILFDINPTNGSSYKWVYTKSVKSNRKAKVIFEMPDSWRVEWRQSGLSTGLRSKVIGRNVAVVQFPQKFWYILECVGQKKDKER